MDSSLKIEAVTRTGKAMVLTLRGETMHGKDVFMEVLFSYHKPVAYGFEVIGGVEKELVRWSGTESATTEQHLTMFWARWEPELRYEKVGNRGEFLQRLQKRIAQTFWHE